MDEELLTRIFWGAISSLALMLLAPRIYRWIYPRKKDNKTLNPISHNKDKKISFDPNSFSEQKEYLSDLRYDKVLTELEYVEKMKILKQKEQESLKMQKEKEVLEKEKLLDSEITILIEPQVAKLTDLLNVGVIFQTEFEDKKQKLFTETKTKLKDIYLYRIIKFKDLEHWQQESVMRFNKKAKEGNVILYNKRRNSVFLLTREEFTELQGGDTIDNYYNILF